MCVFCVRVDELVSVLLVLVIMLIYFLFTVCVYVLLTYMTLLTCVHFLVFCSNSLSFAFKASDFQCLHSNGCWCLMLGSLQLYI